MSDTRESRSALLEEEDYEPTAGQSTYVLCSHIAQKGYQAGSVIGSGVGVAAAVRAAVLGRPLTPATVLNPAAYGAAAGLVAISLLGGLRVSQLDTDGITDRAYRLHFNQGQNRVDLFAQIGSVLGLAAAAALTGLRGPAITCLGGAAAGATLGVLAHVATMAKEDKAGPNRMLHEATTA